MAYKDPEVGRVRNREANARFRKARREKMWAETAERIFFRDIPPMEDCIWAAGHFEGEGTICMSRNSGKRKGTRCVVSLTSTDFEVIDFFNNRWPGSTRVFSPKSKTGNAKPAKVWLLNSRERVERFLRDIDYYVKTARVRRKLELVLEDLEDKKPHSRDDAAYARSEQRKNLLHCLNRRGLKPSPWENESSGAMPTQLMITGPA